MYQFTQLDNNPKQEITMILDDNSRVTFNFEYISNQLGWFFGIKYQEYNYQNIRLTTGYNILRAYRNYLPFGLRVETQGNEEPTDQNDFINNFCVLYLLTKEDVITVERNYYAKV